MNLRSLPPLLAVGLLCLVPSASVAASKAQKAEGAALYSSSGCAHCHAVNLAGTDDGPSLQGIGKSATHDELTHQIVHGGGGMPPFRDALNDDQIARLVDFLQSQKKLPKGVKPAPKTPGQAPAAKKPNPDDSGE